MLPGLYIFFRYCNSRVLKFSSNGQFVNKWGKRATGDSIIVYASRNTC